MTNSKRTGKTQASVHAFTLDDYHYKDVCYRKWIPVTAGTGPVTEGRFRAQPQSSFRGKQIHKTDASFPILLLKKKKNQTSFMIFHPVIILMKSNESFLVRVTMYLNHVIGHLR